VVKYLEYAHIDGWRPYMTLEYIAGNIYSLLQEIGRICGRQFTLSVVGNVVDSVAGNV